MSIKVSKGNFIMAIQRVVKYGEKPLRTPSKEVHKVSSKIQKLVKDLFDTMYASNGVGLAAPQIGVNYRVFVIDTAMPDEPPNKMVFINPKIIKKTGAMNSLEGCLSFPGLYINVRRYSSITIKAKDLKGRTFIMESSGENLLTRALQHEPDHLDGVVFVDRCRNVLETDRLLAENELPPIEAACLIEEPELEAQIQEWERLNPPEPPQPIEEIQEQ